MTSARTNPPAPDLRPPGRHRRALVVLGIVLLPLVFLSTIGVPPSWYQPRIARLREQGLQVYVDRVRLDPLRGLAAEGLRWFDAPGRPVPMLEAEQVVMGFDPREWLKKKPGLSALRIRGGIFRVNTEGCLRVADGPRNLVLEHVGAKLRIRPDGLRVERLRALLLGIRIRGHGELFGKMREDRRPLSPAELARLVSDALAKLPAWLPALAEQLNAVDLGAPATAEFQFAVYPAEPLRNEITLAADGQTTRARGVTFDSWHAEAELRKGRLTVPVLWARQGAGRCDASGSLELGSNLAEAKVSSSLDPACWLSLVPERIGAVLRRQEIGTRGAATFEVWAGPSPLGQLAEDVGGWVSARQAEVHGVWVEKGFVSFRREGPLLTLDKVEGVIGRGRQQGPVRGTASLRLDTWHYQAKAAGEFDPNAVYSLWTKNQRPIIRALDFTNRPPVSEAEVSGCIPDPKQFNLVGRLRGTNFLYRGAAIVEFDSPMTFTNGTLTFDPLLVVREEGRVTGRVAVDFDRRYADVDATSTADPYAVGRIIGPNTEKFLRGYRFEGPARVVAKGRVDYHGYTRTDIDALVEGERMGMKWALADRCSFRLRGVGTRLELLDAEGSLFGGQFVGDAVFERIDDPTNVLYEIRGAAEGVDFGRLAEALKAKDSSKYKGALSGQAAVRGIVGVGKGGTVVGRGHLRIREGTIFQIPLFGGLSQMLSRVYPGLGFATQTDFQSSFAISKGRVHTTDAMLEGSVLSAKGVGYYCFNEKLDVNVQVQLLRTGPVASIVRLITFPVTKLLEFHLGGHLESPKWRPVNLPKEMFLIFD